MDAGEPLLSREETEALLAVVRASAGADADDAAAEKVDLAAQDGMLRASLPRAERTSLALASEVRKMLRRLLGLSATVREVPADVVPQQTVAASVSSGAGVAVLATRSGSLAFVSVGPALSSIVLDRRLGATIEALSRATPRVELSAVDRRVMRAFADEIAFALGDKWCNDGESFVVHDVLGRPADVGRLVTTDPCLRMALRVDVPQLVQDQIVLVLTPAAVRDTAPPSVTEPLPAAPTSSAKDRRALASRLGSAEVDVVAVLGQSRSTIRELLALGVGDVIRLDQAPDDPLPVTVGGITKLRGMPVVYRGNLAVRITETVR
jgi:flagellar motor switch protein FliM